MQIFRVIPFIKLENDTQQLNVQKQYREIIHLLRGRRGGGGGGGIISRAWKNQFFQFQAPKKISGLTLHLIFYHLIVKRHFVAWSRGLHQKFIFVCVSPPPPPPPHK